MSNIGVNYNKRRPIQGWGINDVDYMVVRGNNGIRKKCPYYADWERMIRCCFSDKEHKIKPTYKGCSITDKWKYLSNFIEWVDSQPNKDWQNCDLDKDLLVVGNKEYSPETCVYIQKSINKFILDSGRSRGSLLLGVTIADSKSSPYMAQCQNPFTCKQKYLGVFSNQLDAHKAWQSYKHQIACQLADLQSDPRVAKALRERYSPDKDWTKV